MFWFFTIWGIINVIGLFLILLSLYMARSGDSKYVMLYPLLNELMDRLHIRGFWRYLVALVVIVIWLPCLTLYYFTIALLMTFVFVVCLVLDLFDKIFRRNK